jgi:hypothetical protein
MASIDGHHRIPSLLVLWAMAVVVTFTLAGARIHYLLINALFDSLALRFSADDRPQPTPSEDGISLEAALRPGTRLADKPLRQAEGDSSHVEA